MVRGGRDTLALAGLLWLAMLVACGGGGGGPEGPTPIALERGDLPEPVAANGNPLTVEGVALGRRLFHDPLLSADRSISCASCHVQRFAFSDPRRVSRGVGGVFGEFNAPGLTNAAWLGDMFWDGHAGSLEQQAGEPVQSPIEMALPWADAVARLQADPEYPGRFEAAFPGEGISRGTAEKAMAQFQRTITSYNSRFDRFRRGELSLTPAEARGYDKYLREDVGDCFHCHGTGVGGFDRLFQPFGPTLPQFQENGLDLVPDIGREAVTGEESDRGKFKVPTLRNIALTAPYMHDGRFATLMDVLDHYSEGFVDSPNLNAKMRSRIGQKPLMTQQDKEDIVAFLHALTDSSVVTREDLSDPFAP